MSNYNIPLVHSGSAFVLYNRLLYAKPIWIKHIEIASLDNIDDYCDYDSYICSGGLNIQRVRKGHYHMCGRTNIPWIRVLYGFACGIGNWSFANRILYKNNIYRHRDGIIQAIGEGHMHIVRQLYPFFKDDGMLLVTACANGRLPMVKFLLSKGYDHNMEDSFRWAAGMGQLKICKYLVKIGYFNTMDQKPLLWAEQNNHEKVLQFLKNHIFIGGINSIGTRQKPIETPRISPWLNTTINIDTIFHLPIQYNEHRDTADLLPSLEMGSNSQ